MDIYRSCILFHLSVFIYLFVGRPWCNVELRDNCRSWFSSSSLWVLGIILRSSGATVPLSTQHLASPESMYFDIFAIKIQIIRKGTNNELLYVSKN